MPLGVTVQDAIVAAPLAFVVGFVLGYRLRRYRVVKVNGERHDA